MDIVYHYSTELDPLNLVYSSIISTISFEVRTRYGVERWMEIGDKWYSTGFVTLFSWLTKSQWTLGQTTAEIARNSKQYLYA